jgi:hypothetical protein
MAYPKSTLQAGIAQAGRKGCNAIVCRFCRLSQYDETAIYRSERVRREQRAYGDDSCDEKEARIFAASAAVGRQGD